MRINQTLCHGVKGRVLLRQGRSEDAASAFEQAADVAALNKYGFLEAVALRDWKAALSVGTLERGRVESRFQKVMSNLGWGCKPALEALVASLLLF